MLTSKVYDFNIDIIEKKNEYKKKLESKINMEDMNDINQPDISELPKQKLFVGDSVYARTYEGGDNDEDRNPFDDLQKSVDAGIVKKISAEDILPITPTPTQTKQPDDGDFIDLIDKYVVETEKNKITAWHLFFILFLLYILAHIFSVNFKFNVDI